MQLLMSDCWPMWKREKNIFFWSNHTAASDAGKETVLEGKRQSPLPASFAFTPHMMNTRVWLHWGWCTQHKTEKKQPRSYYLRANAARRQNHTEQERFAFPLPGPWKNKMMPPRLLFAFRLFFGIYRTVLIKKVRLLVNISVILSLPLLKRKKKKASKENVWQYHASWQNGKLKLKHCFFNQGKYLLAERKQDFKQKFPFCLLTFFLTSKC